jgi:Domain of unknown function (DUF4340)
MNKKTTFILLGALILLVGGYFAFFYKWHGPDNEFFITDPQAVGKIEIEEYALSVAKKKIVLEVQKADAWTVNGTYPASESKMKDFLKTLMEIRVLQPIEPKGQGPALSLLKRNHIQVRIWDRAGKELKNYLIGATNSAQTANVFKMDYSDKCYLVSKPALQGYVSIYYSTELLDWREKLLWNVAGADLAEIAVTYAPDSLRESFVLQRAGLDWMLDGAKAEPNRVNGYLELFQGKVFAESFADANFPGMLDSLSHKRTPEARIRLTTQDQKSTELLLFARPENVNDFFAYLAPGKELITVQHFVIDKFLKRRSFFVNQN